MIEEIQELCDHIPYVNKNQFDVALYQAIFLVAYFWLFRMGELTSDSSQADEDESTTAHILTQEVRIQYTSNGVPFTAELPIHCAKTGKDDIQTVVLDAREDSLCPIRALLTHIKMKTVAHGLLFMDPFDRQVRIGAVNRKLVALLSFLDYPPGVYSSHSLRAGGATRLALEGKAPTRSNKLVGGHLLHFFNTSGIYNLLDYHR